MNRTTGFFKPEEGQSRDERTAGLNRKLSEIIDHAWLYSPAFRSRMNAIDALPEDIKTIEDLRLLPVLNKSELVELQKVNPPFGGLVTVPSNELRRVFCSPGPIYEPWPKDYHDDRWAEAFYAAGMRKGDKGLITFALQMTPFGFMLDESMKMMEMTSFPTGFGNTETQIEILRHFQIEVICGTPSFINTIGQKAREMDYRLKKDLNLKVAFVAAEMLPRSLRQSLEEDFDMLVRQSYGTADIGCLGFECFHANGMHYPENCIIEIVDPDTGKVLEPGQTGEIVATCFDPVYPLIRFGTGDLSSFIEEDCPCKRTSNRLTSIMGRVDQVTKIKGMFVHPGQITKLVSRFDIISNCRLIVTRENNQDVMTLQVELEHDVEKELLETELKAAMKETLRLKGEVKFIKKGTILDDSRIIEDKRIWD